RDREVLQTVARAAILLFGLHDHVVLLGVLAEGGRALPGGEDVEGLRHVARFDAEVSGARAVYADAHFGVAELQRAIGLAEVLVLLESLDEPFGIVVELIYVGAADEETDLRAAAPEANART